MEIESQPNPVPLGDVKELLEKELSIRENKLRCIECGNFQAVPEIEPVVETPSEVDGEESDAPVGPTCDSCGSTRLNLIEQIQYEHKLALDHVRLVAKSPPKQSKEIMTKVIELEHVDDYYAAKIADILPVHPDDVRSIFARERFSLGKEEIASIISAVKETTGA
jgi:DNA-directed RNA polymerase subunit F|tara:strand:- start:2950 stop:3444 length:495 start_codon:yes stop_codon:yes gene_type:complete